MKCNLFRAPNMLYGQEIKSPLFRGGASTFLHEITEESWAFVVPENQVRARSLVLSSFSFTVAAWTPRGCHWQAPVFGRCYSEWAQRYCSLSSSLLAADLPGTLCAYTVHWPCHLVLWPLAVSVGGSTSSVSGCGFPFPAQSPSLHGLI